MSNLSEIRMSSLKDKIEAGEPKRETKKVGSKKKKKVGKKK